MKIKRISLRSTAFHMAFVFAIIGLYFAVLETSTGKLPSPVILSLPIYVLVSTLLGIIASVCLAFTYNLAAKLLGGIRIDVE